MLIEIPHRKGHLDEPAGEALSDEAGLLLELPLLAHVGTKVAPAASLDLDAEVQLVCKYLHADHTKSIDALYTAGGGRKVRRSDLCTLP